MRLRIHPHNIGRILAVLGVGILGIAMLVGPAGADPPGNNGTIKLDGLGLNDGPGHSNQPNDPDETSPDNDPHVSCGYQVEFFNFDTGQTADITFTAHPPTGHNGVLSDQSKVLISNDGTAGAPNDVDAVFDYDVFTDFDLTQFTSSHDVHGWHVKLAITVYDVDGKAVPGAKKHKVFWVDPCEAPTTTTTTTTTTSTTTTTTSTTTTTLAPTTETSVLGAVVTRAPTTTAATRVLGAQLPRTGMSGVFLVVGLTALSVGLLFEALAQMARRRATLR